MDIGAYVQMADFEQIVKDNGIYIPRLRGYRLMKDEKPISREEMIELRTAIAINCVKDLCTSKPFWSANPYCYESSSETDRICNYYLVQNEDEYIDIRWDRIHGKKRKILKFEIKKAIRKMEKQYEIWNKYAGKENILYIHSRMGGGNWKHYEEKESITNQPWFLDRVDDWFDNTYCDFYAKININKEE